MTTILFVCEHGAAKSIVAAAHFDRLAAERGLAARALARATDPEPEIRPAAIDGLALDGLVAGEPQPVRLSRQDVERAQRIVIFCELPAELASGAAVEEWTVPAVSDGYGPARDAIVERIAGLLDTMEPAGSAAGGQPSAG